MLRRLERLREQLWLRQHHGMICCRDACAARQPRAIPNPGVLEPEGLVIPAGEGLFGTSACGSVELAQFEGLIHRLSFSWAAYAAAWL